MRLVKHTGPNGALTQTETDDRGLTPTASELAERGFGLLTRPGRARNRRLVRHALQLADLLALSAAFALAGTITASGSLGPLGSPAELAAFCVTLPCWVFLAKLHGLYDRDAERPGHSTADEIVDVGHLATLGVWLLLVASFLTGIGHPRFVRLLTFWMLAICILPVARLLARELCRRNVAFAHNAAIVGTDYVGQLIGRKLIKHPEYGTRVVGFVDDDPEIRRPDLPETLTILGPLERLPEIIKRHNVERVVISLSDRRMPQTLELIRRLHALDVQIDLASRPFELAGPRASVHAVEGLALLSLPPARLSTGGRVAKRAVDIVIATGLLALTAPLFAYIALRIRLNSPGPILFRQIRLGAKMKQFTLLKFRTMKVGTDPSLHRAYVRESMSGGAQPAPGGIYKLDRSAQVTSVGRWLRRTSLDELPQLINVLRGEMSLVGPRPCIPYETEGYQPYQFERFQVPQGLTGLWQVTARAKSSYGEALDMDVAYARDWSLWLDLRLLLRTPVALVRQRASTA
ncbi:MAG: sugar transferase [Solirubrobacterales bacterium]|nr:sugar transferase [Solirubrobacterales bacterium]MBV9839821.1 sugar transferase [Solirubrobacterales bacterium]